ncbi:MAG: hypothetical protein DMG72_16910 [Acidobacteria bacterium]|nr:MAG: hypothetical protein DMG72_16910 [Acidobacteriota bacterium]
MQIALEPRARKFWLLGISMLVATVYMALVTREFVAAHLASRPALASRQRAVKLEAGNADYRHALGSYFALVDPSAAVEQYKAAVQLNPHAARYWLDLAAAYQVLNNPEAQKQALDRAIQADPTTPDVAWEAANLSLVQGDTEKALREFRVVLQNDPHLRLAALQRCWVASPDVDTLLQRVVPAQVEAYLAFLNLLMAKKETVGTVKVWSALMQLHQHFESRSAIDYIKYLILQREVEQARSVWQQAADMLGLSAYLPSAKNLIVNGTFSLDVLNGGFDWQYRQQPSVTLTLDPSDFHGGHRSLSIVFDGPGVSDAGVYPLISFRPAEYQLRVCRIFQSWGNRGRRRTALRDSRFIQRKNVSRE